MESVEVGVEGQVSDEFREVEQDVVGEVFLLQDLREVREQFFEQGSREQLFAFDDVAFDVLFEHEEVSLLYDLIVFDFESVVHVVQENVLFVCVLEQSHQVAA